MKDRMKMKMRPVSRVVEGVYETNLEVGEGVIKD